jgi:carboxyl-terminal processing protease
MNDINQKKVSYILSGLLIVIVVFFIGKYIGQRDLLTDTRSIKIPEGIEITNEQFEPFWKVWKVINDKFVTATTTDSQKRVYGAIQGLASSQGDPYTVFFPPEENTNFKSDIAGNFEGVGMEIGLKDGMLTVVSPLKGSPAEKAGVRPGEKIIKINDKVVGDLPVEKAVKMIRGPKGTIVKITFVKPSGEQVERPITRDVIDIPTIEKGLKNSSSNTGSTTASTNNPNKIGDVYTVRLYSFTAQSPRLFREAMREFVLSGSHKLIIDLRGNPGGYLDAAWDMASWFLPVGATVVTEDFGGKATNQVYRSKGYNIFDKNLKLLVLVDGGSASASEILAGALKENGVARLVGSKTFGKGSVQELVPITEDTSFKVTIARWLTPSGHNLSHDGLVPDFEVKPSQKDIDAKKDVVMDKALEILSKEQ